MPATIGDNSNALTPAEAKALYMMHFRDIQAQTEICKAENAERKRLRKLAKADGVILADIDFGLRIMGLEDPMIVVDEHRRRGEIANYFALPIGTQSEFDFNREPLVERAAREGEYAGSVGKNGDSNPYDPNSEPGRVWEDHWKKAQAEIAANWKSAMEKRQAERASAADPSAADNGQNDPPEDDDEIA